MVDARRAGANAVTLPSEEPQGARPPPSTSPSSPPSEATYARAAPPITTPLPCTPRGVIELLQRNGYDLNGKHVVVVGRGVTIGRSIGLLLTRREINATVTLTHTGTADLSQHLKQADVIVAAAGVKHIVRAADVKPGAAVLDVGVTRETDPETGKSAVYGDVDPDVADVAGWLSPNPGGVGPMTVALLMTNVVEAAERGCPAER